MMAKRSDINAPMEFTMNVLNDTLAAKLAAVQRPGDYFVSGTVEAYLPQLEVESVGRIALPLLPQQAQQLVAVATQAPYGRGTKTLIDTTVRKTHQINADQVKLGGRHWPQTLQEILGRVVTGLSVTELNCTNCWSMRMATSLPVTAIPKRNPACLPRW